MTLLAGACSTAAEQAQVPDTLPIADGSTTTTSTRVRATAITVWTTIRFEPPNNNPEWHGITTTSTAPSTTTTTTQDPATDGPDKPVVTNNPSAPQQPSSLYKGVLGTYGLDQVVASSPIGKPIAAAGVLPLTGLPGSVPNRPAVVVKVDNSSKARPQSGLNKADIVFEEQVEYGITRFAAVFHTNDTTVGPVRSGRSTDISFLNGFGTPALAYSGANKVIDQLLVNQTNVSNYSAARSSGYWRSSSRPAPSNLYTKTSSFSSVAPGGPPPAQFQYRPAGVAATQGVPHGAFRVSYPANKVRWEWNGSAWVRQQAGASHTTDGEAVTAANVVVVGVSSVGTGLFDSTGAPVPEYLFVGEGNAVVFTDGRRIDGRWTRPTLRDPALLHVEGQAIELTPGRTWIQIVTSGQYSKDG
jgi:hypothetical protein